MKDMPHGGCFQGCRASSSHHPRDLFPQDRTQESAPEERPLSCPLHVSTGVLPEGAQTYGVTLLWKGWWLLGRGHTAPFARTGPKNWKWVQAQRATTSTVGESQQPGVLDCDCEQTIVSVQQL